jgi:hypothetical protein
LKRLTIIVLVCWCVAAHSHAQESTLPLTVADGAPTSAPGAVVVSVTLRFDAPVPDVLDVVRLARTPGERSWRVAETSRTDASGGRAVVRGSAGLESLLLIRGAGQAGYIIDGPFRWPVQAATYFIRARWRRTVRGRFPLAGGALTWIGQDDRGLTESPSCNWTGSGAWECVGVPLDAGGVVVATSPGQVHCALPAGPLSAAGVQASQRRSSTWGRLLIVSSGPPASAVAGGARVMARRLITPRARPQSLRLEEGQDDRIRVDPAGDGAVWISGNEVPDDGWIEIGARDRASERLEVRDVAGAPAELPLRVQLQPSAVVSGRVTAGPGVAAPESIVTLYRFASRRPTEPRELIAPNGARQPQKRIAVAEVRADADGVFRFDDLARERYEIVAMHPTFGRGEVRLEPDGQEVEVALRRPARAVGRVVRDGVPAAGVRVVFVPALAQFATAGDVTELRGGEAETDHDGRFTISLAPRGSGELRVGDERAGVRRVPLGPAESLPEVVQVGTIELDALPPLTLVFEAAGACSLLLTGPDARSGMSVIRASRLGPAMFQAAVPEPGRWHVVAVCGPRERAVMPATIDVVPGRPDVTIRLMWPQ